MNKITLKNGKVYDLLDLSGLRLTIDGENIKINDVENIFNNDNLSEVQFSCGSNIFGQYKKLELNSYVKMVKSNQIIINLNEEVTTE